MKILHKIEVTVPFEIGKVYMTKFQTRELFTLTKIDTDKKGEVVMLYGIYDKAQHLGPCPLQPNSLIPETKFTGEYHESNLCPHC